MIKPIRNTSAVRAGIAERPMLAGLLNVAILSAAIPTGAQQQQPPSTTTSSNAPKPNAAATSNQTTDPQPENVIKNDRLFGVIPNYTTVETEDKFGPLSAKGKFKMAADSSFDPYTFPFIGFIALVGQAENSEPSYGQGLKGYAKRYGTSYGDAII